MPDIRLSSRELRGCALAISATWVATAMVLVERPVSESIVKAPVSGELESRMYVIKQEILSRDRLTQLIHRFNLYPELRKRAGITTVLGSFQPLAH